jgi:hypothetical protein
MAEALLRQRSGGVAEAATGERFDYVVSLCDRVREVCRDFPGAVLVHRSIADPRPRATTPRSSAPRASSSTGSGSYSRR